MKYGFIGLGNMAGAIIRGMRADRDFASAEIYGYNRTEAKTLSLARETGLIPCADVSDVAGKADVIVLAVKPQVMPSVFDEIGSYVSSDQILITIAAGLPVSWYEERLAEKVPVVRAMPNINAKVRCSFTALCTGKYASDDTTGTAEKLFRSVGDVCVIDESLFGAFSAISGSSGAFVFLFIDALADAGVRAGLSKAFAQKLAVSTVIGSGRLLEESGEHPIALMDSVCSPGGTTIEGVLALKKNGFESAVHEAVQAMIDKNDRLGR